MALLDSPLVAKAGAQRRTLNVPGRLLFLWFVALALLALASGAAPGKETAARPSNTDARALVEQTTVALLSAFQRQQVSIRKDPRHAYGIVDEILSPHVDYPRVTRLILGKYWRQATPSQREQFIQEFRALQIRTYATAMLDYTDVDVRYLPTRQPEQAERTTVRTQIPRRNGTLVAVDYRLHRADGPWKVYDVLIEGVSLLTSYRASIGAQIAQVGIDGVIERLAAMNRTPAPATP